MTERNQRKSKRFNLELAAGVEVETSDQENEEKVSQICNFVTRDICSGGAFFYTAHPLPEGTEVKIELVLDLDKLKKLKGEKAFISTKGKVLRVEPEGMAICFEKNYKIGSL